MEESIFIQIFEKKSKDHLLPDGAAKDKVRSGFYVYSLNSSRCGQQSLDVLQNSTFEQLIANFNTNYYL